MGLLILDCSFLLLVKVCTIFDMVWFCCNPFKFLGVLLGLFNGSELKLLARIYFGFDNFSTSYYAGTLLLFDLIFTFTGALLVLCREADKLVTLPTFSCKSCFLVLLSLLTNVLSSGVLNLRFSWDILDGALVSNIVATLSFIE